MEHDPYAIDLAYEQRRIRKSTATAAVLCGAVLVGACYALPRFFVPPQSLAERIAFALQGDVFVLIWLIVGAQLVSSGRYHSVVDNRGSAFSPPSPRIAIRVAFLQNTLEQAVMAVGVHLALASLLTGPPLFFVPASVALVAIGRASFLKGYSQGRWGTQLWDGCHRDPNRHRLCVGDRAHCSQPVQLERPVGLRCLRTLADERDV